MGAIFAWLGRSKLGQALFTLLIERLAVMIQESIARERERRRKVVEKQKLFEDLNNAKTEEEHQSATNALAHYIGRDDT